MLTDIADTIIQNTKKDISIIFFPVDPFLNVDNFKNNEKSNAMEERDILKSCNKFLKEKKII